MLLEDDKSKDYAKIYKEVLAELSSNPITYGMSLSFILDRAVYNTKIKQEVTKVALKREAELFVDGHVQLNNKYGKDDSLKPLTRTLSSYSEYMDMLDITFMSQKADYIKTLLLVDGGIKHLSHTSGGFSAFNRDLSHSLLHAISVPRAGYVGNEIRFQIIASNFGTEQVSEYILKKKENDFTFLEVVMDKKQKTRHTRTNKSMNICESAMAGCLLECLA